MDSLETLAARLEKPAVTLNGTSRDSLVNGYADAARAIADAIAALALAAPHARDYMQGPGAGPDRLRKATAEHVARVAALERVRQELTALAIATIDAA